MTTHQLTEQENELVLDCFNHQDALEMGLGIIALARENDVNVAVHIEKNRVPLFTHLMEGTTEENHYWLYRKRRVVDHYQKVPHSSKCGLKKPMLHTMNIPFWHQSAIKRSEVPSRFGWVEGVGMVGTVTVAGLTGELDHRYAVRGIKRFLARKATK